MAIMKVYAHVILLHHQYYGLFRSGQFKQSTSTDLVITDQADYALAPLNRAFVFPGGSRRTKASTASRYC